MIGKRSGVRIEIKETGDVFNSLQECADYLGVNVSWLGRVSRGDGNAVTCRGYHILRLDDSLGHDRDLSKTEYRGRPGVKVKIVETGEVFDSIYACAKHVGGSPGTIHDVINNKRNRTTHKGLHFEIVE